MPISLTSGGGGGGGIASGTSFPASPTTNELFQRTDLGLIFYYDGTRWLTVNVYTATAGAASLGSSAPYYAPLVTVAGLDIWAVGVQFSANLGATNNGTNYWKVDFSSRGSGGNPVLATLTTSADNPSTYVSHSGTVGAVVAIASYATWEMYVQTVGAPSALGGGSSGLGVGVSYRLIGV